MKSKSLYILLLLYAFFLFTSEDCSSGSEEAAKSEKAIFQSRVESIEEGFEAKYLSETSKIAFEEKAKHKLIDFGDYFSIYSNKSLDTIFRENSKHVLMNLFYSEENTLKFGLNVSGDTQNLRLQESIEAFDRSKYDAIHFTIDSIQTMRALERQNETTYGGKLKFVQEVDGVYMGDTILLNVLSVQCDFYVTKVNKKFGGESRSVWKVFLGNMD